MSKRNGFTLVEVLITVCIFSIIIGSIYAAFNTGLLSYRKIDSSFESYQPARVALNKLELELKNSFAYKKDDSYFKGQKDSLDFFTHSQAFDENGNPVPAISRVVYRVEAGALKRLDYPGLKAISTEPFIPEPEALAEDLKEITFEYACPEETAGVEKKFLWLEKWPKEEGAGKNTSLPLAVKIKMVLKQGGELVKVISLPLSGGGAL